MTITKQSLASALFLFSALATFAQQPAGQAAAPASSLQPQTASLQSSSPTQPLFDFRESDIKFNLRTLMNILRDNQHEGWVLAAYPDPKTSRPLIGAGFSLDVQATDHPQRDPLNPHPFLEPSSAQLWQAAGLEPGRLQQILDRFDRDLAALTRKKYRRKIRAHSLTPELTEEEATRLLRISTIQAVSNARAYCRNFDQLTGPQQMALSQLVFQMGVNLEKFVQFLAAINNDSTAPNPIPAGTPDHWRSVQTTLMESQWARRYSERASTVIAMFDPSYVDDPVAAERRIALTLRPPSWRSRRRPRAELVRVSTHGARSGRKAHKSSPAYQRKRKVS